MRFYEAKTAANARRFVRDLNRAAPMKIRRVLTDSGKGLTDRLFGLRRRSATSNQSSTGSEPTSASSTASPRRCDHQQTAWSSAPTPVENVLQSHHFQSSEDLEQTKLRYVRFHNGQSPQSAFKDRTPVDALKDRQRRMPSLSDERLYTS